MSDIVRGRINLRDQKEVIKVLKTVKKMAKDNGYKVLEEVKPRRPIRYRNNNGQLQSGHGYGRYHLILKDKVTGIAHEWQIGTKAATAVWEKVGIKVPDIFKQYFKSKGIENSIHDIEYHIFQKIVNLGNKDDAHLQTMARQLKLKEFTKKVDLLAAQAAKEGDQLIKLEERIDKLHIRCGILLKKLAEYKGFNLKKF